MHPGRSKNAMQKTQKTQKMKMQAQKSLCDEHTNGTTARRRASSQGQRLGLSFHCSL